MHKIRLMILKENITCLWGAAGGEDCLTISITRDITVFATQEVMIYALTNTMS